MMRLAAFFFSLFLAVPTFAKDAPKLRPADNRPMWGSTVWVDYTTAQVWALRDMADTLHLKKDTELKKTGEEGGYTTFAPPAGFLSAFITHVAVNFTTNRLKDSFYSRGLTLELCASRMETDMLGYRFVPNIYKVDIEQPPLSCRGSPTTSEARKMVEEFSAHALACTP